MLTRFQYRPGDMFTYSGFSSSFPSSSVLLCCDYQEEVGLLDVGGER